MQRKLSCVAACAYAVTVFGVVTSGHAQSIHATRVVAFDDRGQLGGGNFDPSLALGPMGGGGHVHSLGRGGFLTLGFAVTIVDGPGADLIVGENPFGSTTEPWKSFAEVAFVEVSSNGTDFARFPARYTGPQVQPGPFDFLDSGAYGNLTGRFVVNASAADPQDVVDAGGDAFDLADLANDPLVLGGQVDLNAITEVRIVDAESGVATDTRGVTIYDTGGVGSADIDGVTVIQHAGNQSPNAPRVDLTIPADGRFSLTISDPDGLTDLDPASLRAALWGNELAFGALLDVSGITQVTNTSFTMELLAPLPPGILLAMQVSVKDRAGHRSGASRTRP